MNTRYVLIILIAVAMSLTGLNSCRNGKEDTGRLQIRLIDEPSPYDYDAIYLDVTGVEVNVDQECCEPQWITMRSGAGVYNLLTLVNGVDVLLVNEEFPAGRIEQVRLILGAGNTIVVDGVSHPLTIPSGQQSGLKINIHRDLPADRDFTLVLDFDAAHSIELTGSGSYHLKPVVRGFFVEETGIIHGVAVESTTGIAIIATAGSRSYTTYADPATGDFLVRGIAPGTYTVRIYYPDGHVTRFDGIVVQANTTTELGR